MTETNRPSRPWLAFAVLMLPVIVASASMTALSFGLPAIAEALQPTGAEQLWIIDVYPLVLAALLIPAGALGDRYGRRRMLTIGATGFALVSIASMLAPSALWLILARGAAGVFGSMLLPSTLALIRSIFEDASARSRAVAIWSATFAGAGAIGPVLGGILLEHFPWTALLLVGLPFSVLYLVLAPALIPEASDPEAKPVDVASAVLAIAAMALIVAGMKELTLGDAPLVAAGALLAGLGIGAWFVRRQARIPNPMIELTLLRIPEFRGGLGVNLLTNAAQFGFIFLITQHLQVASGLAPTVAGIALLPASAAMIVATLFVPKLQAMLGARRVIALGLALAGAGLLIVTLWGGTTAAGPMIAAFAVLDVGLAMAWTASIDLILAAAPASRAGAASAISETAFEVGAVLGMALIGGIATALYQRAFTPPASAPADVVDAARQTIGAAAHLGQTHPGLFDAAVAAFIDASRWTCAAAGIVMLISALVTLSRLRGSIPTVAGERHVNDTPPA